jgi:hypothetical protein
MLVEFSKLRIVIFNTPLSLTPTTRKCELLEQHKQHVTKYSIVNFCLVKDFGKPITVTGCVLTFTDWTTEYSERVDSYLRSYTKLLLKFTQ